MKKNVELYFPGGGHAIYYDQPDLYLAAVRAFLLNQPLTLPLYKRLPLQ